MAASEQGSEQGSEVGRKHWTQTSSARIALVTFLAVVLGGAALSLAAVLWNAAHPLPPAAMSLTREKWAELRAKAEAERYDPEPWLNFRRVDADYGDDALLMQTSADEPSIDLSGAETDGHAVVEFYDADDAVMLDALLARFATTPAAPGQESPKRPPVDVSAMRRVAQTEISVDQTGTKILLPTSGDGVMLVRATAQSKKRTKTTVREAFVVRSSVGAVATQMRDGLLVWTQDFGGLKAVASGSVEAYSLKGKPVRLATAAIGRDGTAKLPLSDANDIAVVRSGATFAVIPLNVRFAENAWYWGNLFGRQSARPIVFAFVDRPIYKPGDAVKFKALIRRDDDAALTVPGGALTVELWNANANTLVDTRTVAVNARGAVFGEFAVPADMTSGYMNVKVKSGEADVGWAGFRVEEYRKPEYSLAASSQKNELLSGDNLAADLSGSYFSGQPLAGVPVRYRLTRNKYYEDEWRATSEYKPTDVGSFWYWNYGAEEVTAADAALDGNGRLRLSSKFDLPPEAMEDQIVTLSVEYAGDAVTPAYAATTFAVRQGEFGIYRTGEWSQGARAGKGQFITVKVLLARHTPDAVVSGKKISVSSVRKSWAYGDGNWKEALDTLANQTATTDADGVATFQVPVEKEGSYEVALSATDSHGRVVNRLIYEYAYGPFGYRPYQQPDQTEPALTVTADKKLYAVGDRAVLHVASPTKERQVLLTVERREGRSSRVVELHDGGADVTLPVTADFLPNIFVTVAGFSNAAFDSATTELPMDLSGKKLTVTVTPGKKTYAPGETVTLTVRTLDQNGRGVPGEAAVWAVDKALYELVPPDPLNVFDAFWYQRGDGTSRAHSLMNIGSTSAEKGGGGGDSSVRTDFRDAAYWNPDVRTDANGVAVLTFKVADNLTTWVVNAVGSTADNRFGKSRSEFVVSKDVVVRPVLPNVVREGDRFTAAALLQNFTEAARDFAATLSFDAGGAALTRSGARRIPAGGTVVEYWYVTAKKVARGAQALFSVAAVGDAKMSDAVRLPLPVEYDAYREKRAWSRVDSGDLPLTPIAGAVPERTTVTLSLSTSLLGSLPPAVEYVLDYAYGCAEQTASKVAAALVAKSRPEIFGGLPRAKELDPIIADGLKRLATLQAPDGSWGWWYGSRNDFLTSYIVEYLVMARDMGVKYDAATLDKARNYLEHGLETNTVTEENKVWVNRALQLVGSDKAAEIVLPKDAKNVDLVATAVLGNAAAGRDALAKSQLATIAAGAARGPGGARWSDGTWQRYSSDMSDTALALRALIAGGADKTLVADAARTLVNGRPDGYWGSTYGTVQAMRALIAYADYSGDLAPAYAYKAVLDGKTLASGRVTTRGQRIAPVAIPYASLTDVSALTVTKDGAKGTLYWTVATDALRRDKEHARVGHGLTVERSYENTTRPGEPFNVGDTVHITITVKGFARDGYGVVTDELPGGLIPVIQGLDNERFVEDTSWQQREYSAHGVTFPDVWSVGGDARKGRTYTYDARVVSEGSFTAPPATASLMYEPAVFARSGFDQFVTGQYAGTAAR